MGFFGFLKKKTKTERFAEPEKLYAPISGKYLPILEIPDEVFSGGILGIGCGIEPTSGEVVAPVNGVVSMIAEMKHAIGILSDYGAELLIHIGMDTVEMKGKGFRILVNAGDRVVCGQHIMSFNIDEIKAAGHPATTAFVAANSDDFSEINISVGKHFNATEEIGSVKRPEANEEVV